MSHSLVEMTDEIVEVFRDYEATGTHEWIAQTAVSDLPYQVGSLTKVMMQLSGDRFNEGKTEDELLEKAGDELADILAEVLFIAHELDLDIAIAWQRMIASDKQKISTRTVS